jgi:hypothetical protein
MSPPRSFNWRLRASQILFFMILAHFLWQVTRAPQFYRQVVTQNVPTIDMPGARSISNQLIAQEAEQRGMRLPVYAAYSIALTLVISFVFLAIALLVAWKAGDRWYMWFTAFILTFYPTGGGLWLFSQVTTRLPLILMAGSLLWPLYWLFLYLFPNGKAVPRAFLWPILAFMLVHFGFQLMFLLSASTDPAVAKLVPPSLVLSMARYFPILLLAFLLVMTAQVIRFWRISTPIERMQTRWVVMGLGIYITIGILLNAVVGKLDMVGDQGYISDLDELVGIFIPVSIGISILRFHLFDIDLIVRRTVVYSLLTALLAALYYLTVLTFQAAFRAFTGQESPVSVVPSTLVVAALFNPIRRRLQGWIDRAFFRRKYDTEHALATFGASLRENLEFDQMAQHLVSVVDQSLQPREMSLWLISPEEISGVGSVS